MDEIDADALADEGHQQKPYGAATHRISNPAKYPVVLEHYAVDDMLEALSFYGNGRADGAGRPQLDE